MFRQSQRLFFLFLIVSFLIAVSGCSPDSKAPSHSVSTPDKSISTDTNNIKSLNGSLWENPHQLCNALKEHELTTLAWKAFGEEWYSDTNYRDLGSKGHKGLPTNLSFTVFGISENRAVKVQIVLNVNNPDTRQIGLDELAASAKDLLRQFGEELSDTLEANIKQGSSFNNEDQKIRMALRKEQTKIETFVVEFSDPSQPLHHFELE